MASTRERTSTTGETTWQVLYRHAGKQRSHTFADPRSAEKFRQAVDAIGPDKALAAMFEDVPDPNRLTVDQLAERFLARKARDVTARTMTDYRRRQKEAGATVKVAKNRLAKLAAKDTNVAGISELFKGQTCIAYSKDPIAAAKVAIKYAKENEKLVILGGTMGNTVLGPDGVKALAELPSLIGRRLRRAVARDALLSKEDLE